MTDLSWSKTVAINTRRLLPGGRCEMVAQKMRRSNAPTAGGQPLETASTDIHGGNLPVEKNLVDLLLKIMLVCPAG